MKNFLLSFVLLLLCSSAIAQQYKSHTVVKGENVFRIAKRYNTTPEAIYKINPTARTGIKEGEILAIPVIDDQEYDTHIVAQGDTVYSLSKKYNITQELIYILNPEAVNGINLGQILRVGKKEKKEKAGIDNAKDIGKESVIDSLKVISEEPKIISFITHKVKKKETLFGIAKKYGISIEDIKRQNKRLYSEQLRKKDKIRIPVFAKEPLADASIIDTLDAGNKLSATTKYILKAKDTRYGIARRHGITIAELEQLNPEMDPSFAIGSEIKVPTSIFVPLKGTIPEGFELYEVKPKETVFRILKRTKISSDSLFRMNPYLRDGLKEGMVLVLPKDTLSTADIPEGKYLNLERKLWNFKPKKIAVMLPFSLDTLNFEAISEAEEYLKKKQSLRIALGLYSGMLIAVDSAKAKGITTELTVYDTKKNKNTSYIKKILSDNNFDELDAVVGPLYQNNLETVAGELKKYDIPVFSPASRKKSSLHSNFFQTRPTNEMLQERIMSYVEKDSTDKNIVIIVQQGDRYTEIKEKLIAKFPAAKVARIEEGNYLYEVHLGRVLAKNKPNWIFLESNDVAMLSNVIPLLNAKAESHEITLFTSDKNSAFDDDSVKNEHLSNLHLHYSSFYKEFDNEKNKDDMKSITSFEKRYKKEYKTDPGNWAIRGFDIMYDVLLRLGAADDVYHGVTLEGTTEYVESKFRYIKKPLGGYYNTATYLVKFDKDLKLSLVD